MSLQRLSPIALSSLMLIACDPDPPRATAAPEVTASVVSPPLQVAKTEVPTGPSLRFVPPPADGDLAAWILAQRDEARRAGEYVVVYESAPWCEPCRRFHEAIDSGAMEGKLPRTRFLQFDVERDGERLAALGYMSKYVPLFALPGDDGHYAGAHIEGSVKGPGAPGEIAPRLSALLAGRAP